MATDRSGVDAGKLADLVVERGYCSRAQVEECLVAQQKLAELGLRESLAEILVKKRCITEEQARAAERALRGVSRIANFELLEKVGQGGMGAVFRARQISMDRVVAIKVLTPALARDKSYTERFLREARASARLNHLNIIQGIDVGEDNGYYYFAMEFVDGPTCKDVIKKTGRYDVREALDVAQQMACALEHAEKHGMVHRDIKPDNIMIASGGVAKLCDLGLAKDTSAASEAGLTQVGQAVGTPDYISPEQAQGKLDVDIRTDIYSLGATLYHMITGHPMFDGATSAVIMAKHLTDKARDPREERELPEGVAELMAMMTAKKPEDRHQTAAQLREDIESLLNGEVPRRAASFRGESSIALTYRGPRGQRLKSPAAEARPLGPRPRTRPSRTGGPMAAVSDAPSRPAEARSGTRERASAEAPPGRRTTAADARAARRSGRDAKTGEPASRERSAAAGPPVEDRPRSGAGRRISGRQPAVSAQEAAAAQQPAAPAPAAAPEEAAAPPPQASAPAAPPDAATAGGAASEAKAADAPQPSAEPQAGAKPDVDALGPTPMRATRPVRPVARGSGALIAVAVLLVLATGGYAAYSMGLIPLDLTPAGPETSQPAPDPIQPVPPPDKPPDTPVQPIPPVSPGKGTEQPVPPVQPGKGTEKPVPPVQPGKGTEQPAPPVQPNKAEEERLRIEAAAKDKFDVIASEIGAKSYDRARTSLADYWRQYGKTRHARDNAARLQSFAFEAEGVRFDLAPMFLGKVRQVSGTRVEILYDMREGKVHRPRESDIIVGTQALLPEGHVILSPKYADKPCGMVFRLPSGQLEACSAILEVSEGCRSAGIGFLDEYDSKERPVVEALLKLDGSHAVRTAKEEGTAKGPAPKPGETITVAVECAPDGTVKLRMDDFSFGKRLSGVSPRTCCPAVIAYTGSIKVLSVKLDVTLDPVWCKWAMEERKRAVKIEEAVKAEGGRKHERVVVTVVSEGQAHLLINGKPTAIRKSGKPLEPASFDGQIAPGDVLGLVSRAPAAGQKSGAAYLCIKRESNNTYFASDERWAVRERDNSDQIYSYDTGREITAEWSPARTDTVSAAARKEKPPGPCGSYVWGSSEFIMIKRVVDWSDFVAPAAPKK